MVDVKGGRIPNFNSPIVLLLSQQESCVIAEGSCHYEETQSHIVPSTGS